MKDAISLGVHIKAESPQLSPVGVFKISAVLNVPM